MSGRVDAAFQLRALASGLRSVQRESVPRFGRGEATLQTVTQPQLATAWASLVSGPFRWIDDGLCAARAAFGAQLVDQALAPAGAGAAATGDAALAAVAVQRQAGMRPLRNGWSYHAAPAMRVEGRPELQVLDPLLFDGPVDLSAWRRSMDARAAAELWSRGHTAGHDFPAPLALRIRSGVAVESFRRSLDAAVAQPR